MATNNNTPPALKPSPPTTNFTVGWICVLKEEFRAALAILDEEYDTAGLVCGLGYRNHYVLGRVGNHNIVINVPSAETYGPLSAIRIALDMRSTFPRMRFILLVGIAGGTPSEKNDIRLGDVVVGTRIVPYTFGKKVDAGFERRGIVKTPPRELLDAVTFLEKRMWSNDGSLSESVEAIGWKAPTSQDQSNLRLRDVALDGDNTVQLFRGVIGLGEQVMKYAQTRDEIAQREDILCYEMEAIGIMEVAPCLSIRGISDYSDGHKNDDWQLYASLAAATCARELLLSLPAQVVARFPVTIDGDILDRYITGAAGDPDIFSGGRIERLRQTRDSLMERHALLQQILRFELQQTKRSCNDDQEKREEVQRLHNLGMSIHRHLEELQQIIKESSDLNWSTDQAAQAEYFELKSQVQKDRNTVGQVADAALSSLGTTSTMLKDLGKDLRRTFWCSSRLALLIQAAYFHALLGAGNIGKAAVVESWVRLR
ncbi:nucleoside phosphorylase domain-containing protein [Aspergillus venezuelensis]